MSWADAALVEVVAPANGTNNYVLSNPANQGPKRTDLQAEADGSLSDGDLIHYMVRRITTTGDAEFERGYGAWTKSTRVLARTAGNVLDSDGGPGVLKDWGLSGQMDVYFLPPLDGSDIPDAAAFATVLGLPRLIADNNFQGRLQAFESDEASFLGLLITNTRAPNVSNRSLADFRVRNSVSTNIEALRIQAGLSTLTAGSEVSTVEFAAYSAGSLVTAFKLVGNSLQDASGNKYDAFPSGTKMMFGTAPPSGWTRVNETQSRVIRLAKSGDTIGSTGGSDDIFDGSWTTAGHTLTEAQIPSHTHTIFNFESTVDETSPSILKSRVQDNTGGDDRTSGATGGGGSHSHNMTTPHYFIACWATKD